jgi:hypothetical protein
VETCSCNFNNGNGVCILNTFVNPPGIENAQIAYGNCYLKCARTDLPCLAKNCAGLYCSASNTLNAPVIDVYNKIFPACVASSEIESIFVDSRVSNPFYGFATCDGTILQYSFALVIVLLLGLLL